MQLSGLPDIEDLADKKTSKIPRNLIQRQRKLIEEFSKEEHGEEECGSPWRETTTRKKNHCQITAKGQWIESTTRKKNRGKVIYGVVQPFVITEPQDHKVQDAPQQKRRFRYKLPFKRKLDFSDEKMEDYISKKSTTSTQTTKPSMVFEEFKVVDPTRNIHGEPIIPKDEPVDWDNLAIPELNFPIFNKPKKTKTRAIKKVKPVTLRSKTLSKSQSTVNKGDLLYICDIKEFSDINLYLDELEEIRGIDAHKHLPERLVFKYKGGKEII
ncbi:hypothetical protein AgCh_000400 [Apium graveolens]